MTIGTTFTHGKHGNGTIISIDGKYAKVDFNGTVKTLLTEFCKNAPAKKAKKEKKEWKPDIVNAIKTSLLNICEGNKSLATLPVWSQIMKLADEQGHFASDIVMQAMSGKKISEKQALVVGFFAKNNNVQHGV
jgi:hypothetical protein